MRYLLALGLLLATPIGAQNISVVVGKACTTVDSTIACTDQVGTTSICITADNDALLLAQSDLASGRWNSSTGEMSCDGCAVAAGVTGCSVRGDLVTFTERQAAMVQLYCDLRARAKRKAKQDQDAAQEPIAEPVIGGGEPGP